MILKSVNKLLKSKTETTKSWAKEITNYKFSRPLMLNGK